MKLPQMKLPQMKLPKMKLLCATDLLPKSEYALDRAGLLAQRHGADLSVVHVVAPNYERVVEDSLRIAVTRLKERARPPTWRYEPAPNVIVRAGNPARLIVDTLEQQQFNLLVLGPHRKRGPLDALEGTIAEKIVSARKCPLLMVQRDARTDYNKVLLALDLSDESAAAVRISDALLRDTEAKSIVVHAWQPPYKGMMRSIGVGMDQILAYSNHSRREVIAEIRQLLVREGAQSHRYDIDVVDAHAATAIERALEAHQPDLLVMGTRGHGPVRRALLGSVANSLLASATCDVLIVPRGSVDTTQTADTEESLPSVG